VSDNKTKLHNLNGKEWKFFFVFMAASYKE